MFSSRIQLLNFRSAFVIICATIFTSFTANITASAQDKTQVIRLARLQIDPAQIDNYKIALKEEIETSVRVEAGVLTLYAVYEKDNPTHVTVFEIYANADAFKSHLETPHFKKYKETTKAMVKSLELFDTVPIVLAAKPK